MQVHMKLAIYQKVYTKKYTVYHLLLYILFGVENVYEANALLDTSFWISMYVINIHANSIIILKTEGSLH